MFTVGRGLEHPADVASACLVRTEDRMDEELGAVGVEFRTILMVFLFELPSKQHHRVSVSAQAERSPGNKLFYGYNSWRLLGDRPTVPRLLFWWCLFW